MNVPTNRLAAPLSFEGHGGMAAQLREAELLAVGRREWWLWLSALSVTVLSLAGLLLCSFPRLFASSTHVYELSAEQARWGLGSLLVVFNAWMVYRQWGFRRARTLLAVDQPAEAHQIPEDPSGIDPLTGLATRSAVEQQLGREIARAHRQTNALTVLAFHLHELPKLVSRAGRAVADELLKEFARRMREASRGSDSGARTAEDQFLLVLPKCTVQEAKVVLDRMGRVAVKASGRQWTLDYTSGWIDYRRGDTPRDLLERAVEILELYQGAGEDGMVARRTG